MLPVALLLQLASVVPGLLKFAGAGDTAEKVATQAVEIAKQVTGLGDPQEAVKQVMVSSEAQNAFILESNKQMMAWDQMFLTDVANARERDVEYAKAGKINWTRFFLVGFSAFGIIALIYLVLADSNIDDFVKGIVTLALGRLLGYLDGIYNFEFGTTRNSQAKDATINKLTGG